MLKIGEKAEMQGWSLMIPQHLVSVRRQAPHNWLLIWLAYSLPFFSMVFLESEFLYQTG